jgi:hypothetical protein
MGAKYESPTRRASRGRTISNDVVNLGFVMLRNVAQADAADLQAQTATFWSVPNSA